jgi:hypothetical protein
VPLPNRKQGTWITANEGKMPNLKSLNLVSTVKPNSKNLTVGRRQRLITAIDKQINLLDRTTDDQDTSTVVSGRKTPPWYWMDEQGNYFVSIKYGKKPIEIAKGKFSIQGKSLADIADALKTVKEHVILGEFDPQIAEIAKSIRRNFAKT